MLGHEVLGSHALYGGTVDFLQQTKLSVQMNSSIPIRVNSGPLWCTMSMKS